MNNGGNNLLFPPYGLWTATSGFVFLAVTNTSIIVIASEAWRTVTDPPPLCHRERGDPLNQTTGGGNVEQLRLPSHLSKN